MSGIPESTLKRIIAKKESGQVSKFSFEEGMLMDSTFRQLDMSAVQIIDCNIEGMKIDGVLVTDMLKAYKRAAKL